jgi:hypothetical protein
MESTSMNLSGLLIHAHSGFRWLVLGLLVAAVLNALMKMMNNQPFTATDSRINFLTPRFMEVQFLIGLVLYFVSGRVLPIGDAMGEATTRFFALEHPVAMIVAVALVSIGSSKVKKGEDSKERFKTTLTFFGIALAITLAMIPWPFQNYGTGWF